MDRAAKTLNDFESKMQKGKQDLYSRLLILILAVNNLKKKEKVPLHQDRPLFKLDPKKNFIKLNAENNVLKS